MSELPPEIITDILTRLPVNSLLRFRCVSKPWCSQIDGPNFIKLHLDRSIENNTNLSLILGGTDALYSVDYDDSLDEAIKLDIPFNNCDLLNSCNGLLLLKRETIALFNPSTREYRELPAIPNEYPGSIVAAFYEWFGLGYDSINDDYKVIKIVQFRDKRLKRINSEVKVYSLKSNTWRRIGNFSFDPPLGVALGAYLNGALHLIVRQEQFKHTFITAFDIGAEKFHLVIEPPFPDRDLLFIKNALDVLGGCLCVLDYRGQCTDVWVMKDYGVEESWIKLLSIKTASPLKPLAYSKSCSEILFSDYKRRLFWYDLVRKTIRNAPIRNMPSSFDAEVCVGSLVPVRGCGEINGIKQQHGQERLIGKKENKKRIYGRVSVLKD